MTYTLCDKRQENQDWRWLLPNSCRALSCSVGLSDVLFEDVHWVDPTTLEALSRTVDRLRTLGVLLIVTYRPEFEPPWVGRPHVTALTLNRLGEREIASLIDRLNGSQSSRTA